MHLQSQARTLQGEPTLINLNVGDGLECTTGSIWATLVERNDLHESTDEVLMPGELIITDRKCTYCLSSLNKAVSSYRVLDAVAVQQQLLRMGVPSWSPLTPRAAIAPGEGEQA